MRQRVYFTIVLSVTLLIFLLAGCNDETVIEEQEVDISMPWDDPWFLPLESSPSLKALETGWEIKWTNQQWEIYEGFVPTKPLIINDQMTKGYEIDSAEEQLKPLPIQAIARYYEEVKHQIIQFEIGSDGFFVVSMDEERKYHFIHHWGESFYSTVKLLENQMTAPDYKLNAKRNRVLYFDVDEASLISYHAINRQKNKMSITDQDVRKEGLTKRIHVSPEGGYLLLDIERTDTRSAGFQLYGADSGRELVHHIPGTHASWGKDDQIILFRFEETLQIGIYFRERRQMNLLGQTNPNSKVLEGPLMAADGHHALYISNDENNAATLHILHLHQQVERTHNLQSWDPSNSLREDVYFHGDHYLILRTKKQGKYELFIQDNLTGSVALVNISQRIPLFFLVDHQLYYFVDESDKIGMVRMDLDTTQKVTSLEGSYDQISKVNMEEGILLYFETVEKEKSAWLIQ